jgi:hypothetical protein
MTEHPEEEEEEDGLWNEEEDDDYKFRVPRMHHDYAKAVRQGDLDSIFTR